MRITVDDVIDQYLSPLGIPAFTGANIGHVRNQLCLPSGAPVELAELGLEQGLGTVEDDVPDAPQPLLDGLHPRRGERRRGHEMRLDLGERALLQVRKEVVDVLADHEAEDRVAFGRVEKGVKLSRYGGDCYSYCMLAAGHLDLVRVSAHGGARRQAQPPPALRPRAGSRA